jgi:putative FmdB family regulatory protein
MPTYEYICEACGNEFENFASMSAPPIKKCPKCGKNKVQRKISTGGGIIFKGGGFYETDYRGDAYKKAAEAEKSGGEAKPAETSSDAAKPAETPAPAAAGKPEPAAKPAESTPVAPTPPPPAASKSAAKSRKR